MRCANSCDYHIEYFKSFHISNIQKVKAGAMLIKIQNYYFEPDYITFFREDMYLYQSFYFLYLKRWYN